MFWLKRWNPPLLKSCLVLDAGPDEDAFSFVGVDATSLIIDNLDVVDGGCAGAPISPNSQQVSINGSDGVGTNKFLQKPLSLLELTNVHDKNLKKRITGGKHGKVDNL